MPTPTARDGRVGAKTAADHPDRRSLAVSIPRASGEMSPPCHSRTFRLSLECNRAALSMGESFDERPCLGKYSRAGTFRLVQYSAMTNLTLVLKQLEQERTRLAYQLEGLGRALSALDGAGNKRTGRTISAAGRARIAAAQRARWAKIKGRKVVSISGSKRSMSTAARRRIAAAQKARWAKWRQERKTA